VFLGHDAAPHGAQIFLLRLLRWLRERTDLEFEVVLGGGGPLQREYEAIARVSLLNGTSAAPLPAEDPLVRRLRRSAGLVYSNTITNGRVLSALSALDVPVITHVHELGYWIRHRVPADELAVVRERSARVIAVSRAVADSLVADAEIPAERIAVIHGFVPTRPEEWVRRATPTEIREELGIADDVPIVCACGTLDWRKGADLFVAVAAEVKRRFARAAAFVWLGGAEDGSDAVALRHDVVRAGLEGSFHFVPHRDNPMDYFGASAVFALPSREDPFPLVVMEAALARVPTVCFDLAGGAKEFVEDDCGVVVPYLDVAAMAEGIVSLLADPARRARSGQAAALKVAERHDVDVIAPKLLAEIEGALRPAGVAGETRCA
jgi:glycosyltransferase involved in cell wall biosynthesis